jgi:type III secretory pathway component EscU
LLDIIQSYAVFAVVFAISINAPQFGNQPECNHSIVMIIFGQSLDAASYGQYFGAIVIGFMSIGYTFAIYKHYKKRRQSHTLVSTNAPGDQDSDCDDGARRTARNQRISAHWRSRY